MKVLPGWKAGTKASFDGAGNEEEDGSFQKVVFVVEEKPHSTFKREGDDLVINYRLPLVDALCGMSDTSKAPTVTGIDGKSHPIRLPSGVITPEHQIRISGAGMPKRKDGKVAGKGDLVVNMDIVFPNHLSSGQKEAIRRDLGS